MQSNPVILFFKQHLWWMLLLFMVIAHIPFLDADPDIFLSISRDAHTDEGLNTIQLRNYINHGYLSPWECDNLMKNPLYNLILYIPFKLFGTKLLVGRLTVLIFIAAVCLFIGLDRSWRGLISFLIPVVFFQFHLFHYSHYALAEMMSIGCILVGLYGVVKMWSHPNLKGKLFWLVIGLTGFMFSWFMKIQFVYIMALYVLIVIVYIAQDIIRTRKFSRTTFYVLLVSVLHLAICVGFYYFVWYGYYKEPFDYIMSNQTGNRFAETKYFWASVGENFRRYFHSPYIKPMAVLLLLFLPLNIWVYNKTSNKLFKLMFWMTVAWMGIEVHKLAIHHVPSRYMVSFLAAILVFIATFLFGLNSLRGETENKSYKLIYQLCFWLTASVVSLNLGYYGQAMGRRTYEIKNINNYLQQYAQNDLVVLGAWGPTMTWNTGFRSMPVWKDFLNFRNIKDTYHPDVIVSEPKENDSDGAYTADGYDLEQESDSMKLVTIGRWNIEMYWMKK